VSKQTDLLLYPQTDQPEEYRKKKVRFTCSKGMQIRGDTILSMARMLSILLKRCTKPLPPLNIGEVRHTFASRLPMQKTTAMRFIVLPSLGDKGLPTTSLTHSAAESFLRDALLNKQLRIEIWAPKKGTGQWSVIRKVSGMKVLRWMSLSEKLNGNGSS
jgi:hypothetical protein